MTALLKIAAVAAAGFHRAGMFWPHEGRVVDADTLPADVLARLKAEPALHISPATGVEAEAAAAADLRDLIKASFGGLEPGDFTEDGTPKVEAVRKVLPKGTKGATAALVAEVWAEVKPAA